VRCVHEHVEGTVASTAPVEVARQADGFFEEASTIVGERFAEASYDDDRGLRVSVNDLTDRDRAAITAVAQRYGIVDRIRIPQPSHAESLIPETHLVAPLHLEDGRRLVSPALPLSVTD